MLESDGGAGDPAIAAMSDVLGVVAPGFIDTYVTQGRKLPVRQVTLRQMRPMDDRLYGDKSEYIRSEACLKLDFAAGRLPGLLVMGSEDPHQFTPQHGPDLLAFFAAVFERAMRQWLA